MEQTRLASAGAAPADIEAEGALEFPVTRRGYEPRAVDAYVAASSVELRHLAAANRSLMQRLGDLETRLAAAEAVASAAAAAARIAGTPAAPTAYDIEAPAAAETPDTTGGRLPLFAVNRSLVAATGGRPDQVLAAARAEAGRIVAAARTRAAAITGEADARVEAKRTALVGGLDVLQQAIARTLGELDSHGVDAPSSCRLDVPSSC